MQLHSLNYRLKWFPDLARDIFISHSHKDLDVAKSLSAFLKESLGLSSFIDSEIWGKADILLRAIDKEYCFDEKRGIYRYSDRNETTSHVHMILASAIMDAITKSSCLIFLNTPNSVSTKSVISNRSYSPWLVFETSFANKLLQVQTETKNVIVESRTLKIERDLNTGKFLSMDIDDLIDWKDQYSRMAASMHPNTPNLQEILNLATQSNRRMTLASKLLQIL